MIVFKKRILYNYNSMNIHDKGRMYMKRLFDAQSWISALRILVIVIISIVVYKFMDNADLFYITAGEKVGTVISAAKPFIFAAIIAYIFSPVVEFFDKRITYKVLPKKVNPLYKRMISTLSVYSILLYIVISVIVYILPEMVNSITDLFEELPDILDKGQAKLLELNNSVYSGNADILTVQIAEIINSLFNTISEKAASIANTVIVSAILFTTDTIVIVFALIISAYFIISKDAWVEGSRKIIKALFGRKAVARYDVFWKKMNRTFIKYVLGKALASAVLGVMCFVGLLILKSPYALLISVIFGVTNMIPYFGPFIGEVVGGALVALINPWLGLWVFLYLLALQQVDAFILTPKMVGDALKVSPVWIMFSVILGGQLFGIVGMFFGAPIIAVLLEIIDYRLKRRIIENEIITKE